MTAQVSADSAAQATGAASPVDLSTLVDDLRSLDRQRIKAAILRARQDPRAATPLLIDALRQISANAQRRELADPRYCETILCLLSELRAREAAPAVIELISLPGMLPEDLLHDAITETVPRILAGLAGDQLELLDALALDERVNEWSRAAAVQVREYLVRDGVLSHDEAVKGLRPLLREAIDRGDRAVGSAAVFALTELGAREAYPLIAEAVQAGVVDKGFINLAELEEELGEENFCERALRRLPSTYVEDTLQELDNLIWPGEEEEFHGDLDLLAPPPLAGSMQLPEADWPFPDEPEPSGTIRHAGHVGRNDPCPCGSGKKFKKCCGKPGA